MKVLVPEKFLREEEFYSLKKCEIETAFEDIKKDLTPEEPETNKKIWLIIKNSYNGITFFLESKISGHFYRFSIGKFGMLKIYDTPIINTSDYNKALKIWKSEIIPEIYTGVYNIIGMKQKDYSIEFLDKDFIANLIEVI